MPSSICLVEMHAQTLEWDGAMYTLSGKEERVTSRRLRSLLAHYIEESDSEDEQGLFDGANWALEIEREEIRLMAICNERYGNIIAFDGGLPDVVEEMFLELQGGLPDEFKGKYNVDKWPSWDDDRLYRWDDKVMP